MTSRLAAARRHRRCIAGCATAPPRPASPTRRAHAAAVDPERWSAMPAWPRRCAAPALHRVRADRRRLQGRAAGDADRARQRQGAPEGGADVPRRAGHGARRPTSRTGRRRRCRAATSRWPRPAPSSPSTTRSSPGRHRRDQRRGPRRRPGADAAGALSSAGARLSAQRCGQPLGAALRLRRVLAPRPSRAPAARCPRRGSAPGRCRRARARPRPARVGQRAGCAFQSSPGFRRTLISVCGNSVTPSSSSASGWPLRRTACSTCSALTMPSPVVCRSSASRWPEPSPPSCQPRASSSSST